VIFLIKRGNSEKQSFLISGANGSEKQTGKKSEKEERKPVGSGIKAGKAY